MTLQDQLISLDQAKKLRELGVLQKSITTWYEDMPTIGTVVMYTVGDISVKQFAAFTCAELGIMLPDEFIKFFDFSGYVTPKSQEYELSFRQWFFKNGEGSRTFGCRYDYMGNINISTGNFLGTEAQARAALLIHLIENKIVEVSEINNRLK